MALWLNGASVGAGADDGAILVLVLVMAINQNHPQQCASLC